MKISLMVAMAVTMTCLIGCSDREPVLEQTVVIPTAEDIALAEEILPADVKVAEIYGRSCKSCHSLVDAKAPLAGHKAAWDVLIAEKGFDGLLSSVRNGFNSMPAKGFCADCSDEDFRALIKFMAGREN